MIVRMFTVILLSGIAMNAIHGDPPKRGLYKL